MLTFIIRHLQETAIAALILTAAAAILTGSTWAAVIGGALTLGLYAWLGGRYAYLNVRKTEIDASRPSLAASPSDFDREYVTLHVRPGDLIEPRNSGTSADKKTSVVTLSTVTTVRSRGSSFRLTILSPARSPKGPFSDGSNRFRMVIPENSG